MEEKTYSIPINTKSKFDIFDGIGLKDILIILLSVVIAIVLFLILGLFKVNKEKPYDELTRIQRNELNLLATDEKPNTVIVKESRINIYWRFLIAIVLPTSTYTLINRKGGKRPMYKTIVIAHKYKKSQKFYPYKKMRG